jgi:hypothetical protein
LAQHDRVRPRDRDDDATIVLKQTTPTRRRLLHVLAAGGAAVVVGSGIGAWLLWPHKGPSRIPVPGAPPAPSAPSQARFHIEAADEATILAHEATQLTVFRFASNTDIVVLDFPTLRMQGEMLNRIASLIEKAGLPRDRVLTDAELATAIRARGDTVETYYYGHDYSAASLAFFFATADRQHITLGSQENQLRALVAQLGWSAPNPTGALISVPRVSAAVSETMRATMLHHELSHGEFFTDPAYAARVHQFWLTALTEEERAAVRHFLGSMDYDTANEELMYNEMQAYLMFTYDPRFFLPANVAMTEGRRLQLQTAFLSRMPDGWLKTALAEHIRQLREARQ